MNAVGGWLVVAFLLENDTNKERTVALEPRLLEGTAGARLSAVAYVLALDYRWRADVLIPGSAATLPPA